MFPFSKKSAYSYSNLESQSDESLQLPHHGGQIQSVPRRKETARVPQTLKLVCFSLAFLLVGFFLGQSFTQHLDSLATKFSGNLKLATKPTVFEYQPIYGKGDRKSNVAWDKAIPVGGGKFVHPKVAPEGGRYAVFGQLECLNVVREAYWTVVDAALSPTVLNVESMPHKISPEQVGQCIDLLRQALKCNPDLAIDSTDDVPGTVAGFGAPHQCKDWNQLESFLRDSARQHR